MNALTVDLMGNTPMDEATIQARAQDVIASQWPAWKRERALRLGGVQLAALNAYMDAIAAEVDLARENSVLLRNVLDYESALARLLWPIYDGPQVIDTEDGPQVHPDMVRDVAERLTAQAFVDGASDQVIALAVSRKLASISLEVGDAPAPDTPPAE